MEVKFFREFSSSQLEISSLVEVVMIIISSWHEHTIGTVPTFLKVPELPLLLNINDQEVENVTSFRL